LYQQLFFTDYKVKTKKNLTDRQGIYWFLLIFIDFNDFYKEKA